MFSEKKEEKDIESDLTGPFREIHFRTIYFRYILQSVLVCFFFFHKPEWCLLKPDIQQNCEVDYEGNNYFLMLPFFINSTIDYTVSLFCMSILLCYQYFKYMNVPHFKIEKIKLMIQTTFFIIALGIRLGIYFRFLIPTNLENTMKILFILFSNTGVIRNIARFLKLIKYTLTIITVFLLATFLFALYFRVRFSGVVVSD